MTTTAFYVASGINIALGLAVIYLILAPDRYNPAIRIKYWQETGSWRWPYDQD